MNNDTLISVKRTQIQMVSDRGYDVSNDRYEEFIANFKEKKNLREIFNFNYPSKIDPKKVLHVHYIDKIYKRDKKGVRKEKINTPDIKDYISYLNTYILYESILIIPVSIGSKALKTLDKFLIESKIKHQIFLEEELTYNPTHHIDVPEHILLSKNETDILLRNAKINISMFPLIKINDPIVKYYGWSIGSVLKIKRNDSVIYLLSENSINYRIIIG